MGQRPKSSLVHNLGADQIDPNQKTILALRSGHRCVLYREPLIVDATEYDGAQILGYVAHIKGITGTG